jgi:arylsulfatase A-like enzyme/cytochrome c-type biogenesis protein CcmH/NrfG
VNKKASQSPCLIRDFFFAFLIFLFFLGSMACSRSAPVPSPSKPNLLLVTLDTTRADRIGCYGYQQAETPVMDKLAREGVLFEQAVAVAPVTLPSHASILTGLYPPRHGVRDNADFRLPEAETTLAEYLKQHGYITGAAVGSIILSSNLGLDQGFDSYSEMPLTSHRDPSGAKVQYTEILERPASEVTDSAIAFIDHIKGEPFFLWVHYFDPHYDYTPPSPYSERFSDRLYDGEIAYTDAQLGRLIHDIERRGLAKNTLILVTADHGESLGEHGEETHALFIYEAAIHVPLILKFADVIPAGLGITRLVSGVDLVPTLLELLNLPPLENVHGASFAKAARGLKQPSREAVYAEAIYPERAYGWSPLYALRNEKIKFIEAPEPEFYDLQKDPEELTNLAPMRREEVASWRNRLMASLQKFGEADPGAQHLMDQEARERLASLGYISSGAARVDRKKLLDPKRFVDQHNAFLRAKTYVSLGRSQEAQELLRPILKADPKNPAALSLYGTLLYSSGLPEQGLTQLKEAAGSSPGVFEHQWNLANALHLSGYLIDASKAYRAAISIHPFSAESHYALGNVLYEMKDFQEAVHEYQEAMRLGIESPLLRAALGAALADGGDAARAERELRLALQEAPKIAMAWNKLGILAEKKERKEEAIRFYEKALEAEPDFADALFNHAKLTLILGDLEQARQNLERLLKVHPSYPLAHYLKAHLCIADGDPECARRSLNQFLNQYRGTDVKLTVAARKMLEDLEK